MGKHKLTLMSDGHEGLRISAAVLLEAVGALLEGARLATRFAVEGESVRKGPRPAWLDAACALEITGLFAGSTVVSIDAPTLATVDAARFADEGRLSLFAGKVRGFGEQTAVDLFGHVLAAVAEEDADNVMADRALLDTCVRFAKLSSNGFEGVKLEGLRGRATPLVIKPERVPHIERLRDTTPPPQAARLTGKLDTISASSGDVLLKLKDGTKVPARVEDHDPEALRALFGKDVVISGLAHYRPSGRFLLLDVESIGEAGRGDRLFEKLPVSRMRLPVATAVAQDDSSGVSAFFATWPGEESETELLEALQAIG